MFVTGHLSSAYLLHRFGGVNFCYVALASLFPDLVDKSLKYAGLFATGRHVGHNLFALAVTTLVITCWRGRHAGFSWLSGYLVHLITDLPYSWAMPWFFPLEFGTWHNSVETGFLNLSTGQVVIDIALTAATLFVLVIKGMRRRE